MKYMIQNCNQRIFQNRFYDYESGKLLSPIETQNYTVIQVAESYYIHGFLIDTHQQFCDLELTFSHMNGLVCSANDLTEPIEKHGLHLAFREEQHSLKSKKSARFQTLAINFKSGPCFPLLQSIKEKAKEQRSFFAPEIFGHLTEIVSEFKRSDLPFLENNLDSLITCVLVKLARCGEVQPMEEIPSFDNGIAAVKNDIDNRFPEICSLEELAYKFGYTSSHVSKLFKKAYSSSPRDYLLKKKMDYACNLLKEGARLEEVAVVLGYSTAFNFSRAFKRHFGLSPGYYRKQMKKEAR